MNNHIFDRVETLVGDFAATLAAIHKANKEQGKSSLRHALAWKQISSA